MSSAAASTMEDSGTYSSRQDAPDAESRCADVRHRSRSFLTARGVEGCVWVVIQIQVQEKRLNERKDE